MTNKENMFKLYESLLSIVKGDKRVNFCTLNFTNSNMDGFQYYISLLPMKNSYYSINIYSWIVDSNRFEVEYEYGKYRTLNTIDECLGFIKRLIRIRF